MNIIQKLAVDKELLTRLFVKIKPSTERFYQGEHCWEWMATTNKTLSGNYGMVSYGGKQCLAHRLLYRIFVQDITTADGVLDHLCRFASCVNPSHLELTTQKTNVHRGNGAPGINARKTHCIRGHAFTPENTMVADPKNPHYRRCRQCTTDQKAAKQKRDYEVLMALPFDHPRRIKRRAVNRRAGKKFHAKRRDA